MWARYEALEAAIRTNPSALPEFLRPVVEPIEPKPTIPVVVAPTPVSEALTKTVADIRPFDAMARRYEALHQMIYESPQQLPELYKPVAEVQPPVVIPRPEVLHRLNVVVEMAPIQGVALLDLTEADMREASEAARRALKEKFPEHEFKIIGWSWSRPKFTFYIEVYSPLIPLAAIAGIIVAGLFAVAAIFAAKGWYVANVTVYEHQKAVSRWEQTRAEIVQMMKRTEITPEQAKDLLEKMEQPPPKPELPKILPEIPWALIIGLVILGLIAGLIPRRRD